MEWLIFQPVALWLAAGGILLAVEVATGSGWLLWPAGSAAVMAALALGADLNIQAQLMIFAGLTIVTTLAGRHFFPHAALGGDINDTRSRIAGLDGVAAGDFTDGHGRVFVDGKEWAADLEGAGALPSGARVVVTAVSGARLTVRPG